MPASTAVKRGNLPRTKNRQGAPSRDATPFPREGYFLDTAGLQERLPVSRATIRRYVDDGILPRPIQLSQRRIVWPETEIAAALSKLQSRSRAA